LNPRYVSRRWPRPGAEEDDEEDAESAIDRGRQQDDVMSHSVLPAQRQHDDVVGLGKDAEPDDAAIGIDVEGDDRVARAD
jgi:hypothetical protein